MPMIDLGRTYGGITKSESPESKVYYPEITLRGEKIPNIGDDEFYAVVKCRKVGMRNPSDGEKTCDLEVIKMSAPVEEDMAKSLVKSSYEEEDDDDDGKFSEEAAVQSFRESLKSQIGQSG